KKKTRAARICVEGRNLNEASPKDEYPMPMADMLVDGAAHNQMLSFMDGNAGYNQILVAEEDIHKTAFMCPGHIGAFEYTVMHFGLRNARATYQRAMNSVFHDMIGHSLEVYIDDVVEATWEHIPREENFATNELAQIARGIQMPKDCVQRIIKVGKKSLLYVLTRGMEIYINSAIIIEDDWRNPIINYLQHGPIQQAPSFPMNPVVNPWPFRGRAMDFIGKIYPASNKQHCFIIVATDYFTKWVESKPMLDMAKAFKFKLLQSTPFYAQANGQAESSNKVIINIIRKMLEKNPKQWHEKLSETLWAYKTSKREATGMTPYALTYGHDAILPMEIAVQSLRIAHQHSLIGEDYSQAMLPERERLDASRIDTLNKLLAGKQVVSRAYNKIVKNKSFEEGEILWKAVLALGTHIAGYGKWSPT
ncbi:unnamed protein product, partial [Prunus brigantina]